MIADLLKKISLFHLLYRLDTDLAAQKQQQRCPHCGGPLHFSNYQRKPRGGPENLPEAHLMRLSLCCGREQCRKRTIPPSCRFMGRRVYWGCVVLVVMALRQARAQGASANRLVRQFGISRNTLLRWFSYYKEHFPPSAKWRERRGRLSICVEDDRLPTSLLDHFLVYSETLEDGLVACLQFLA